MGNEAGTVAMFGKDDGRAFSGQFGKFLRDESIVSPPWVRGESSIFGFLPDSYWSYTGCTGAVWRSGGIQGWLKAPVNQCTTARLLLFFVVSRLGIRRRIACRKRLLNFFVEPFLAFFDFFRFLFLVVGRPCFFILVHHPSITLYHDYA